GCPTCDAIRADLRLHMGTAKKGWGMSAQDLLYDTPTLAAMRDDISRLRARIAELESSRPEAVRSDWISVHERLPEGWADVLCLMIDSQNVVMRSAKWVRALYAEAKQYGEECAFTHWMPIPSAPPPQVERS